MTKFQVFGTKSETIAASEKEGYKKGKREAENTPRDRKQTTVMFVENPTPAQYKKAGFSNRDIQNGVKLYVYTRPKNHKIKVH